MPEHERDPDELLITPSEGRGFDSLGPSRSLPARPPRKGSNPLGVMAVIAAALAALALFTLPSQNRTGASAHELVEQALERLAAEGLALESARCPRELKLTVGRSFGCAARAEGVALRIVLTPTASREHGPIDGLQTKVLGTIGIADVAQAAARRFDASARVTCPRLRWVDKPDARQECTMQLGGEEGPLTVLARNGDGELALQADWTVTLADVSAH